MRVAVFLLLLVRVASADPINAIIGDAGVPAHVSEETTRIRAHLSHVLHALRTTTPRGLSPEQRTRRHAALDELGRYIARGEFPRRTDDAYRGRRPRFIDDRGVHCAVGHLVAMSGANDLALAVDAMHEYDYVLDMKEPALDAWAEAHGFTLLELAMIQPQYHEMPADYEAKELLARQSDELVVRCAAKGSLAGEVALHVVAHKSKLTVTTEHAGAFERCIATEASKLRIDADDSASFDMKLSLAMLQTILDHRLRALEVQGCMPRPGELPEQVTVSVEKGVMSVVTAPINVEVAACLFERNEQQLTPLMAFDVRGSTTKPIPRYTPQMFDYALHRAKDRAVYDCAKSTTDGETMNISAGAKLDDDVWVEIPGTTRFAACLREKMPGVMREQLSVPRGGEKYFRIDADVPKRPHYVKCGNGVCY
jgi:hypothetical protein